MNRSLGRKRWLAAAFALACFPAAGVAVAATADNPLDARINIALRDAAPEETFRSFAKLLHAEAEVAPALKGKVTVELRNVRIHTLLDAVCESIGCRWDLQPGSPPKLKVWPAPASKANPAARLSMKEIVEQHIDFHVTDADVRDVLRTFGQLFEGTSEVDPAITGAVTLDLADRSSSEILDRICESLSCNWELVEGPPRVLKVTAKGKK